MAIVNRVIGDCPGCGDKSCFGNVMVSGSALLRGCTKCKYRIHVPLPELKKKVVYLDQSLLSSAFKLRDQKSVVAVERVSKLASKQLLVAPHSNIHDDETQLWSGYGGQTPEQLMRFIKRAARGLQFKPHYEVEKEQAYRAFKAFRAAGPATYIPLEQDVFRGDPHEWHNYVYISVQRPPIGLDEQRQRKERATREVVDAFESWRNTTGKFEEDVAFEIRDSGRIYMEHYAESMGRLVGGDMSAIFGTTSAAECVRMLVHCQPKEISHIEALRNITSFLASGHFAQMPQLSISAHIFAQLKHQARSGDYPTREKATEKLGGTLDDIRHIATYAPYCDAVFVDNAMADLVSRPKVGLKERYGTKIFSLRSLDMFYAWLDEVEASASVEHLDALERVYGAKQ